MIDFILVLTATSSQDEAQIIADAAIDNQLAAAVQVIGPVRSTFQWKSQREHAEEWLCLLKTRKDLYEELEGVICTHHSYELPGILAIPVVAGSATYFEWLQENLKEKRTTVKEQLLQALNEAHEQLIVAAVDANKRVLVRPRHARRSLARPKKRGGILKHSSGVFWPLGSGAWVQIISSSSSPYAIVPCIPLA